MHKVSFPHHSFLGTYVPTYVAVASHRRNSSGLLATCTTTRGVAALDVRASAGRVLLLCQCTVRVPRRGVFYHLTVRLHTGYPSTHSVSNH